MIPIKQLRLRTDQTVVQIAGPAQVFFLCICASQNAATRFNGICEVQYSSLFSGIRKTQSGYQCQILFKANQKADYDAIADEILRLRDMRKQAEVDSVVKDEQMRLVQDLQDFIHQQPTTITEFDETLVKRLITKITVFEDHFTIDFKSGVTIDIEA